MDDLPLFNCHQREEEEQEDEWVMVKKQKITILIPPPSPPAAQHIMMEMRAKPSVGEQPKAAYSTPIAKRRASANKNRPSSSSQAYAHGVGSMGAVNVVNLRMRAMNMERKLGGLPPFLEHAGHRFMVAVLESKKLSHYQLANLTTSKLKDMGMNTVGRRRKLIHAIDLLCQPYYHTAP